ncbi:transmembrane protein 182 [Labeo rohita]|uniref:Transmembrane protein 182 n=1 Tax=Labeo rohita TaxID=84645 RepID=A0A498N4P5_LABRO|nr:transmembrane protein 182 [Labeo rohita]
MQGDIVVNRGQYQDSEDLNITFHHEGFFWRCSFNEIMNDDDLWKFWFVYRGFWSVSMLLGVAAVVAGGFIIICAAPFASHRLYKAGGGLYLISGFFLLVVTVMYVFWLDILDVMSLYKEYQKSNKCPGFELNMTYGLSFMLAPVGVFFCLLSGLLFLAIGRSVQHHCN